MIGSTHRVWAVTCWTALGPALVAREPLPLALGVAAAVACSAGPTSPDVDIVWSPGQGGTGAWNRHRGWTHRIWTALVLTLTGVAAAAGAPAWPIVVGALVGWWSHLAGDAVFGRIRVAGRLVGVGLPCGGAAETVARRVLLPLAIVATAGVWVTTH